MTFTIPTHQDREFTNPTITVVLTQYWRLKKEYSIHVLISDSSGDYNHTLPTMNYSDGNLTDSAIDKTVLSYFEGL